MKRGVIWIALTCLMVTSLVLASCNNTSTATTSTSTTTNTSTSTTTKTTATTTTAPPTTTTSTTAVTGNWWDSLGTPQYGGTMTLRLSQNIAAWDPYQGDTFTGINQGFMEQLSADDWTLGPSVFKYQLGFRPSEYVKGFLASDWEFTDPGTIVFHLKKGILWQNIPPVNGRELTADDIVYHYDRMFGLGDGFTKVSPGYAAVVTWQQLISVTATDKYTVAFKWKSTNQELILETMEAHSRANTIEAAEAVKLWGDVNDWHHAIGTGAFTLQDYVSGSSIILAKNPNYWGYDERYPQNKLPYVDEINVLIIPDNATALAGLRTGKIDVLDAISSQKAQSTQKTNPEILQISSPQGTTNTVDPRNDVKPFNDIRVREAMQMAIDLPTIAKTYYGGASSPDPASITSPQLGSGWGWPYAEWPQDLKDEYAYNPTAAKQLLAAAGYPSGFNTDVVADNTFDLDLLQIVKSYFAAVGINMDIRTMDPASWSAYVMVSKNHDQMATRVGGSLGLTVDPFHDIQRFRVGYMPNFAMVNDPVYNAFYDQAVAATSVDEVKQVLRDANEYVAVHHFVISLLAPNMYVLYQPWLKGFSGQLNSVINSGGVPLLLFQYGARFWIDQNLKSSMGY